MTLIVYLKKVYTYIEKYEARLQKQTIVQNIDFSLPTSQQSLQNSLLLVFKVYRVYNDRNGGSLQVGKSSKTEIYSLGTFPGGKCGKRSEQLVNALPFVNRDVDRFVHWSERSACARKLCVHWRM